ncbi:Hemolysin secretion protein D, chromosomal [Iodobacter fluviatilis]|uniref:Membrane fusion protein (MFP) family protein n=1 Tax=Iodobacter fluviatilis TaxID=537 RepID=A0A377Q2Q0_9NEIS|nr:Hemolysin secretion protein D, chromosomal [Iodobacter fluviatilis]
MISFFLLALIWACLGQIDIVAVAPSKLVVSNQSKIVQVLDTAVVKAIHVRDGQQVKAGQLLIELDNTLSDADSTKNHSAWLDARLAQLKAQALLSALAEQHLPVLAEDPQLNSSAIIATRRASAQQEINAIWQELQAKLAMLDSEHARKQAECAGSLDQFKKLQATLPIVRQRESDFKDLADKNFISKHGLLEKQQARIEAEQDYATLSNKIKELDAAIKSTQLQADATRAEFRRMQNDVLNQASEKSAALSQDVIKSERYQEQTRLISPVDGVVQQLAVHTLGGVVTPAHQALMVIVPKAEQLEAEAILENKDIGFVNAGQNAAIKIETFNYTKYGLLDGIVKNISLDAISDEKRGLIYQARIKMNKNSMNVDGKNIALAPGMAITVEIKTGNRRIIEYFLSPLIAHVSESVRER